MRIGVTKHDFVQKPLAHTIAECRQLGETAAKYKVATQMGNQGYSNEGTRQCAEMIWSGEIGNVTEVHIIEADPPGVFNKEVTRAMMQWKFRPEGEKFLGDVELNFTLKDG